MDIKIICDYKMKEVCSYYELEPKVFEVDRGKRAIEKGENLFLPIITKEGIIKAKWGLVPPFVKDVDKAKALRIYTVESNNILSKPNIRGSIRSRRCLIPISAYETSGVNIGVFFKRIFSIGGVYDIWEYEGKKYVGFAIILTKSNKKLYKYGEYMPVYLRRVEEKMWLFERSLRTIRELCGTYDNEMGEKKK